ncbi:SPOR domain-containing protein [Aliiglaciecola litoralis]|uniref:Cell division protein FtsN n=1 Tax=Aliiglaciecola litoralis TaxID=582857 RepID=A0ABP3WPN6_9ALTE
MAQKDFVKRGQAPKKKPAKADKAKPQLPWLRIIITLSLVVGFAYFLWAISHNSEVAPKTLEAQKSSAQSVEQIDPLPEMPEDKYTYPTELETSHVEIDRKEQQKSERPYLMQCGSFRQQNQADKMRAQLAMQGLESQVKSSDGKNGRWYRVILGPYDYKRDAEADRHVIQRIGISTCQIWYWDL